jgi:hypothetical protein
MPTFKRAETISVSGFGGPQAYETSRLPHFSFGKLAHRWRWDCQYYEPATLYPRRIFLVLIPVTGLVSPRTIVRLEGLGQLENNPLISSGIEPAIFRLVAKCLSQQRKYFEQRDSRLLQVAHNPRFADWATSPKKYNSNTWTRSQAGFKPGTLWLRRQSGVFRAVTSNRRAKAAGLRCRDRPIGLAAALIIRNVNLTASSLDRTIRWYWRLVLTFHFGQASRTSARTSLS